MQLFTQHSWYETWMSLTFSRYITERYSWVLVIDYLLSVLHFKHLHTAQTGPATCGPPPPGRLWQQCRAHPPPAMWAAMPVQPPPSLCHVGCSNVQLPHPQLCGPGHTGSSAWTPGPSPTTVVGEVAARAHRLHATCRLPVGDRPDLKYWAARSISQSSQLTSLVLGARLGRW